MEDVKIRRILPTDNAAMANIIRRTFEEFGILRPGTVYHDASTDHLFELFEATPASGYFVAEQQGKLIGGAGVFPTDGLPAGTCELVKMYLLPSARGSGLGRHMINQCMELARELGYGQMYLETMPEFSKAVSIYTKLGFTGLAGPMGNSGHSGCDIWMLRQL